MRKLNRVVKDVIEEAAASERDLSLEAGYDATSFTRYKGGHRNATPAAARALAGALRRRANLLNVLAHKLETAADKETERRGQ